MDIPFLLLTLLLTAIGLVMVFSASFPSAYYESGDPAFYFKRQAIFAALGIVAMFVVGKINYQRWRGASRLLLGFSVFLLILVVIPGVGVTVNNATRWLGIPGSSFRFQPSEIAKLGVIVYFADSISKKREKMLTWRQGIWPYVAILGIIGVLMMLEPHMSGTILIVGTGVVMMIVGGIQTWLVLAGIGGVAAAAVLYVKLVEAGIISYGANRIAMWHDPWIDELNDGYQMVQSLIAIGSGGLLGVGLGKSRQKFLYLPEEHNDCIFAIVCEELGLIGACVIMLIFALLIIRGFWIALHARDRFGSLLVVGITTQIALQTFLNIAVVSGLVPATGISLPFFSYGGTALALQLLETGIVLSVSRQIPAPRSS
ncbi:MAG: putative lipid II flippase FtsW [Ruminococcaceae bacterium]|nr:putative lipid II flippase FtsW [Oscillospiraceae bacterium]